MTSGGIFFTRGTKKNENVLNKWAQKRIKRWGHVHAHYRPPPTLSLVIVSIKLLELFGFLFKRIHLSYLSVCVCVCVCVYLGQKLYSLSMCMFVVLVVDFSALIPYLRGNLYSLFFCLHFAAMPFNFQLQFPFATVRSTVSDF